MRFAYLRFKVLRGRGVSHACDPHEKTGDPSRDRRPMPNH